MRIAALAFSAVLLSGCSWLGLSGQNQQSQGQYGQYAGQGRYAAPAAQHGAYAGMRGQAHGPAMKHGPCQITAVTQPVPQGCRPEQVTIALPRSPYGSQAPYKPSYQGQGYAQTPDAAAYGRSAYDASRYAGLRTAVDHKTWRRPRFRLTGTTGFETNVSGDVINPNVLPGLYDPLTHQESRIEGTPADGEVASYIYEPRIENVIGVETQSPTISMSDLYAAPFTVGVGGEYQVSNNFAAFGNVSYTTARGRSGGGITYNADVHRYGDTQTYIEDPAAPGTFIPAGAPIPNNTLFPDVDVATVTMTANDLQRTNVEVGGRYYFKDAFSNHLERPLTPFVSAAAGASHYNELEVGARARELLLTDYFESALSGTPTANYSNERSVSGQAVLEKGWVPTGALTVGAEWQVTPRSALSLETGVRYEGARDVTGGGETESFIAIPLTLRGSIGF